MRAFKILEAIRDDSSPMTIDEVVERLAEQVATLENLVLRLADMIPYPAGRIIKRSFEEWLDDESGGKVPDEEREDQ